MIIDISKEIVYYIETDSKDWPFWQTNRYGTAWLNLMGMSWEEMEPLQVLIDEFHTLVNPLATNELKG